MENVLPNTKWRYRQPDIPVRIIFSILTLVTLIGVPAFGMVYGYTRFDWIVFAVLYVFTGLGITVGYHRLISHRSFTCHPIVKFTLLIAGGWAFQNSAIKWSADHVRHHVRVDNDDDPYNAKRGFWFSHVLWVLSKDPYRASAEDKYAAQFRRDPMLIWQERYYVPILVVGFLVPLVAGFLNNGVIGAVGCLLLAGIARAFLVLNSTFCINSVCHLWGKQPHGTENTSRDSWLVSLITFGEGYHNYHHNYARDYRNGPYWWNFDPSKWLIYSLYLTGVAGNLLRGELKTT